MKREIRLLILLIGGILALTGSAFAVAVTIDWTNASNLSKGNVIQWTLGGKKIADPNSWGAYIENKTWAVGDNKTEPLDFYLSSNSFTLAQSSFVRAWSTSTLPTAATDSTAIKYGYVEGFNATSGLSENLYAKNGPIALPFCAAKPAKPTVVASDFSLTYLEGKGYQPKFTLTGREGAAYQTEISGWQIMVRKKGAEAWKDSANAATLSVTEDPAKPYYTPGEWYIAQSGCKSNFGNGEMVYSSETLFQIPTTDLKPAGELKVYYNLGKNQGGLGVNSIGIPFVPFDLYNADETVKLGEAVSTLDGLIKAINKTEAKVTAVSYWDARVQKLRGVAYESQQEKYQTEDNANAPSGTTTPNLSVSPDTNPLAGKFEPRSWNLIAGKAYYVAVDREVSFVLKK